ncbi:MAG: response regulator [Candidatus Liptonbacteria bacterium]|nr:response regulator [Candidatus Liptonbacteria bacterium]
METTTEPNRICILLLEDNVENVRRVESTLKTAGLNHSILWVKTNEDFAGELSNSAPSQIILSGWKGTAFEGLTALDITRERTPTIPFLFVTNSPGDSAIIEAFRRGATDFIVGNQLSTELIPAITRALEIAKKRLGKYLPICSHCKKIREGTNQWYQLERFFTDKVGVRFSHSICPDCFAKQMADIENLPLPK